MTDIFFNLKKYSQKNNVILDFLFFGILIINIINYRFLFDKRSNWTIVSVFVLTSMYLVLNVYLLENKSPVKKKEKQSIFYYPFISLSLVFLLPFVYIGFRFLLLRLTTGDLSTIVIGSLPLLNLKFVAVHLLGEAYEEFLFRKCLYEFLLLRSIPFSSFLSSLTFAFGHPTGSMNDYFFKTVFSLELNLVYKKTSSLANTILMHWFFNIVVVVLLAEKRFVSVNVFVLLFFIFVASIFIILINKKMSSFENKLFLIFRSVSFRRMILSLSIVMVCFVFWLAFF